MILNAELNTIKRNQQRDNEQLPPEHLPNSIKDLLRVLDMPAVLLLIAEYGGTRLCVPKIVPSDHPLVRLIGYDAARLLSQLYNGGVFDCPRCLKALNAVRDNEILSQKRAGLTLAELAKRHHLTERGICLILRRVEKQELQARLQSAQLDWLAAS